VTRTPSLRQLDLALPFFETRSAAIIELIDAAGATNTLLEAG